MYLNVESLTKDLERLSKNFEIPDLLNWKATSWAQVIALSAGLNPFGDGVRNITPSAFLAFIPKVEHQVTKVEQKLARKTLKNAIRLVNNTILEATTQMYQSVCQYAGGVEIPGFDQLMEELSNDLFNPQKRADYFNAGASMMSPEENWTGKHHLLGVCVLEELKINEKIELTKFLQMAESIGLTVNGKVTFNPFEKPATKNAGSDLLNSISKVFKKS